MRFAQRLQIAYRAAVGIFSDNSLQAAHGMLRGVLPGGAGTPPVRGTADFLRAYSQMPWLRAVASRVSTATARAEWQLYAVAKNGQRARREKSIQRAPREQRQLLLKQAKDAGELKQILDHPMLDLLHDANEVQTGLQMRKLTQLYLDLVGDAFWLKERDGQGTVVAVWPIPPHWILNTPTPTFRFYRVGFRGWKALIPDTEFVWFCDSDPLNPYGRGSGSAMALTDELETDEYAARMTKAFFYNQARPDLIVWPKGDPMSPQNVKRLEEDWLANAQGVFRSFKPYFMTREVEVKELEQNFRSLTLVPLREFERDAVMQHFGVPPEILGVLSSSNRATIDSADYFMSRYVVDPRLEFQRTILQERLAPEYDDRLIVDYVSPIQEDKEFHLKVAMAAPWSNTVDEWREMQGKEPLEDQEAGKLHPLGGQTFGKIEEPPPMPEGGVPGMPGGGGGFPPKPSGGDKAREREVSARAKALFNAAGAQHHGLLVSLWLEPQAATALAVHGGEAVEQLHVTLAYCGDIETLGDVKVAKALVAIDRVAREHPPLSGTIGGFGRFTASHTSDGKDVVYAVPDVPHLSEVRSAVARALAGEGVSPRADHGWTPHITLAYVEPGAAWLDWPDARGLPVTFSAIRVSIGKSWIDLPLSAPLLLEAAPSVVMADADIDAAKDAGDGELVGYFTKAAQDEAEDLPASSAIAATFEPALQKSLVRVWRNHAAKVGLAAFEKALEAESAEPLNLEGLNRSQADVLTTHLVRVAVRGADLATSSLRRSGVVVPKYSDDQPRVPAGEPDGGQWTSEGGGGGGAATEPSRGGDAPMSAQFYTDDLRFKEIQHDRARISNSMLAYIDQPDHPEMLRLHNEMKSLSKEMHQLNADKSGLDGVAKVEGVRDVAIVGAGPGGLSTAIMTGSDDLDTVVIEAQTEAGGQSKVSAAIVNYPGYPVGAAGDRVASDNVEQAQAMGAELRLGHRVVGIEHDPETGFKTLTMANGETVTARAVVLAGGQVFNGPQFPGGDHANVFVTPEGVRLAERANQGNGVVVILGGSNGAAQAARGAAQQAQMVHVITRGEFDMSSSQMRALEAHPRVRLHKDTAVDRYEGGTLYAKNGLKFTSDAVGVYWGGKPQTNWLPESIKRERGAVAVNGEYETSMPGVYAVGDIRFDSPQRIGAAVGDGQTVARNIWRYFDRAYKKKGLIVKARGKKLSQEKWERMVDELFALDIDYPWLSQTTEEQAKAAKYSEDQPRDDHGRWTETGAGDDTASREAVIPSQIAAADGGKLVPTLNERSYQDTSVDMSDGDKENGAFVGADGSHGYVTSGERDFIQMDGNEVQKWLDTPGGFSFIHTHPASGPPSINDFAFLVKANNFTGSLKMHAMVVRGKDGSEYSIQMKRLPPPAVLDDVEQTYRMNIAIEQLAAMERTTAVARKAALEAGVDLPDDTRKIANAFGENNKQLNSLSRWDFRGGQDRAWKAALKNYGQYFEYKSKVVERPAPTVKFPTKPQ